MTLSKVLPCLALAFGLAACEDPAAPTADASAEAAESATASVQADGVLARPILTGSNRKFVEAVDICLNSFPNTVQARSGYRSSGYSFEGNFRGTDYFTAFNRSILAFTSSGSQDPVCGFGRNGLRGEEAVLLVNGILAAKYGENLLIGDTSDDSDVLAAWVVTTENDTEVVVFVRRQIAIPGVYRGSLVFVVDASEE